METTCFTGTDKQATTYCISRLITNASLLLISHDPAAQGACDFTDCNARQVTSLVREGRCLTSAVKEAGNHAQDGAVQRGRATDRQVVSGQYPLNIQLLPAPWSHTALENFAWPAMAVDVLTRRV